MLTITKILHAINTKLKASTLTATRSYYKQVRKNWSHFYYWKQEKFCWLLKVSARKEAWRAERASLLPASGVRPSNRQRKGEQTLLPAQKDFKQCITWLVMSAYTWNEGKFSVSKEWTPVPAAGRVVMLGTSTHAKELEKGRREKAWPVLSGCTLPLEHPRGTS